MGLTALPQVVLPDVYGSGVRLAADNQFESSAASYAGIVAILLAAPLAFCSRRHRPIVLFFSGLILFSMSWCLNLPGFVQLLRLPLLNLMSHNRLVFATSFSILVVAAVGLETLLEGRVKWRRWFWIPPALLLVALVWCAYRSLILPDALETGLTGLISEGQRFAGIHSLEGIHEVQGSFAGRQMLAGLWCLAGLAGWYFLLQRPADAPRMGTAFGSVMLLELLSFAWGRNPQSDGALYYPPVPALESLARADPGSRIIGFSCLPANLAVLCGLNDVRGYDGVDPARYTALLSLGAAPNSPRLDYASVQQMVPNASITAGGELELPPVLDLLGVKYLVFRGSPVSNVQPAFVSQDYWVLKNPDALPRAFVPRRVHVVADPATSLKHLAAVDFKPREAAYVEGQIQLPDDCQGTVQITHENPSAIDLALDMSTSGLVVIADRWDPGWQASLNGVRVPILRVNHALRGVVAPAGRADLHFRYEPQNFKRGLLLSGAAAIILLLWATVLLLKARAVHPRVPLQRINAATL